MSLFETRALHLCPHPELSLVVDLELERGQLVRIGGPSGVGKTSLLRALARLSAYRSGELLLDGQPASEIDAPVWRRQVALLPQRPVMFDGDVLQNLRTPFLAKRFLRPMGRDDVAPLLEGLGLAARLLEADARTLSAGEAARVALCRTLLTEPKVILLDELTANLDPRSAAVCVAQLAKRLQAGLAIVLVAHDTTPWQRLLAGAAEIDLSHCHAPATEQPQTQHRRQPKQSAVAKGETT